MMKERVRSAWCGVLNAAAMLCAGTALAAMDAVQLWEGGPYFATCNVGANAPEEYGDLYTFGNNQAKNAAESLGSGWRLPTKAEFDVLLRNCSMVEISPNSGYGYRFTGKGDYSSNSIFLPAAGYKSEGWPRQFNEYHGYYWSSSVKDPQSTYVFAFVLSSQPPHVYDVVHETVCMSVRAVRDTPPDVTVTLDGQGGEGGSTSVTASYGTAMPSATMPTKAGYTFDGYWTGKNGTGTLYYNANGSSARKWDKTEPMTLYAQWTANTYAVTLNPQGGEGGTESVEATYDAAMPSATMPTRTGYTFAGYFDATEDGVKYYNASGTSAAKWDKTEPTTLYAQWTVNTYTLSFDAQGGEGGTASALVDYLTALPKVKVPTRAGYTFLGYFDRKTAEATKYYAANGSSTNVYEWTENATLYAQWKGNSYKYILDGGSFTGEQAVVYGQLPADLPRIPVAEGKEFLGYFDEMSHMIYNAEGEYVGGTGYAVVGDAVLVAMWGEKPETVEIVATKQRWPWNGKMDITYVADSLHAERSYVLDVELTVMEPGASEPVTRSVLVSIPSENGERTVMADFGGVVAAETLDANASVELRLMLDEK